jgi:hypothetical protein
MRAAWEGAQTPPGKNFHPEGKNLPTFTTPMKNWLVFQLNKTNNNNDRGGGDGDGDIGSW